jgi:hypothetical protein
VDQLTGSGQKGYQTLVDELTTVSYRDGMDAALKLNEIARKDEGAMDRARMMAQMGRIIEVVRTFIPAEYWPDVQAALRGETPVSQQTSRLKRCAWWTSTTPQTRTTPDGRWTTRLLRVVVPMGEVRDSGPVPDGDGADLCSPTRPSGSAHPHYSGCCG